MSSESPEIPKDIVYTLFKANAKLNFNIFCRRIL